MAWGWDLVDILSDTQSETGCDQPAKVLHDAGEGHDCSPAHSNDANIVGRPLDQVEDGVARDF